MHLWLEHGLSLPVRWDAVINKPWLAGGRCLQPRLRFNLYSSLGKRKKGRNEPGVPNLGWHREKNAACLHKVRLLNP